MRQYWTICFSMRRHLVFCAKNPAVTDFKFIKRRYVMKEKIERYFKIKENNSTIQTEIFAGLTAFFTMVYLLFLVPNTLMSAFPEAFNEAGEIVGSNILHNGLTADQMLVSLTIAACVAAAIGTLITALRTGIPFAQGPSLAIATFITYTVCGEMGYTYEQALAAVFLSGIVFFILTHFGLEHKIRKAIPHNIKYAVTAGIGLFIAFMGMQKCHMVVADSHHLVRFVDFVSLSDYNTMSTILCIVGLVLIAVLHYKHIHGAILIGKIIVIIAAVPLGLYHHGEINLFKYDFGGILPTAFKMDFAGLVDRGGSLSLLPGIVAAAAIVATLCIMDVIETMSTVIATDHILDHRVHHDETNEKIKKTFEADAAASLVGASLGITTVSTFVESSAMAVEGGRTGFSGVVTAILFILAIFIAPFASVIPSAATATTLIITGVFMMAVVKQINFHDVEEGLPAFFTLAFIPLTYNLINGVALGLVMHTFINLFSGKGREVKKGTYIMTALFVLIFVFM